MILTLIPPLPFERTINLVPVLADRKPEKIWLVGSEISKFVYNPSPTIFPYDLITQEEIDRLGEKAKLEIFSRCKSHLDDSDLMIALLDGPQVDDGTAWEIGYFYAKKNTRTENYRYPD